MGGCVCNIKTKTNILKSNAEVSERLNGNSTAVSLISSTLLSIDFEDNIINKRVTCKQPPNKLSNDLEATQDLPVSVSEAEKQNDNCIINVVVLGDKGVGKSTWVETFVKGKYEEYDVVSISLEEHLYEVKHEGKTYKLHFYIVPGDEQYQKDYKYLFASADFFLAFYDVTSKASFDKALNVLNCDLKEYTLRNGRVKNVILIGNKCDLVKTGFSGVGEVQEFCKFYKTFLISAKNNAKVQLVLKRIIEVFIKM
jgi:small GTP-binding protein